MIDLQRYADMAGAGNAHSELCRIGHPTDHPRFPGEIEYQVTLMGPYGDRATIEVMADSLAAAKARAVEVVRIHEMVPYKPFEDEFIKVIKVCAFD